MRRTDGSVLHQVASSRNAALGRAHVRQEHASLLDVSFGIERHFIRGRAKTRLRLGLALVVMLAMALGRIQQKQEDALRCLVRAA